MQDIIDSPPGNNEIFEAFERYCKPLPESRVLTFMYLPISADLHEVSPVMSSGRVFWSCQVGRAN